MLRTKLELTQKQLEILEPLFKKARRDLSYTGEQGGILMQPQSDGSTKVVYFPPDAAKYVQAILWVGFMDKPITEFMELKEGVSLDDNNCI
jgi:hypothetical protein